MFASPLASFGHALLVNCMTGVEVKARCPDEMIIKSLMETESLYWMKKNGTGV